MATETMRLKIRLAGRLDALASPGPLTPADRASVVPQHPSKTSTPWMPRSSQQRARSRGRVGSSRSPGRPARARPRCCASRTRDWQDSGDGCWWSRRPGRRHPSHHARSVPRPRACTRCSPTTATAGTPTPPEPKCGRVCRAARRTRRQGSSTTGLRRFVLRRGDRIVVDEAGMVDLQTAAALVDLALEHGVGVAMVGDPHQALPVGHAGAMASAVRYATASVELDTVHRFSDPEYAALTLRLRNPRDRDDALTSRGGVARARARATGGAARRKRATQWSRPTSIGTRAASGWRWSPVPTARRTRSTTPSSNDASTTVSWTPRRLRWGWGSSASWSATPCRPVATIRAPGSRTVRNGWCATSGMTASTSPRSVTVVRFVGVSRDYALEHLQLAYASTVHGIQGETTDAAVVGPDVDAAGLYVGLTRGRHQNVAITIARTDQDAIAQHRRDDDARHDRADDPGRDARGGRRAAASGTRAVARGVGTMGYAELFCLARRAVALRGGDAGYPSRAGGPSTAASAETSERLPWNACDVTIGSANPPGLSWSRSRSVRSNA